MKQRLILIICIFVFVFFPGLVSAQAIAVSLTPSFQHIITKPNRTLFSTFTLINNADPTVYTFKLYQLKEQDQYGNLHWEPVQAGPVDITITEPDVYFDTPFLTNSRKSVEIPVRIDIREAAPEGEYMFAFAAETDPPRAKEGTYSTRLKAGQGSVILVTVTKTGNDERQVKPILFETNTSLTLPWFGKQIKIFNSNEPIPFTLMVKNTGLYHSIPKGNLYIKQQGTPVGIPLIPSYILPESQRLLYADPTSPFTFCQKNISSSLCGEDYSFVHKGFLFGFFEATAQISYGEHTPQSSLKTYFVVLPFYLLFILSAVIMGGVIVVFLKYHNMRINNQ